MGCSSSSTLSENRGGSNEISTTAPASPSTAFSSPNKITETSPPEKYSSGLLNDKNDEEIDPQLMAITSLVDSARSSGSSKDSVHLENLGGNSLSKEGDSSRAPNQNEQSYISYDEMQNLLKLSDIAQREDVVKLNLSYECILDAFNVFDENNDGLISQQDAEDLYFVLSMKKIEQESSKSKDADSVKSGPTASMECALPVPTKDTAEISMIDSSPVKAKTTPRKKIRHMKSPKFAGDDEDDLNWTSSPKPPDSSIIAESSTKPPLPTENSPPKLQIPAPEVKSGFVVLSPSSKTPSKGKYHVLDSGVLYHLDSTSNTPPFGLNKICTSLQDRALEIADDTLYLTSVSGTSETIVLRIKDEDERDEWIHAITKHIKYLSESNQE